MGSEMCIRDRVRNGFINFLIKFEEHKNTRIHEHKNTEISKYWDQTAWLSVHLTARQGGFQSNPNHYKIDPLIALINALLQSLLSGLPP